ncbi:MAG: hypothetical protein QOF62_3016 [Pyrinomonadaceae bacterium]|jgi:hypothetical protein|nr:hypothetical protein [Pyrinomonadaceae bacterium]
MQIFQDFGALIESRWRKENYNELIFPELAAAALTESNLPAQVDPWEIIRWVQGADSLPDQKDAEGRFGDPPITLYAGPRFYVDVYFWLDGTTSIHQHAFTGAFQVLLGSSIHSRYSFNEKKLINEHFCTGEIKLEEVQLLQLNDVRLIKPGRNFIHSLFHLDRPSATITVRTEHTPSSALQWDYRKPYFASNPFYRNQVMAKKLQTIGLLLGMKHKDADTMIGDLICASDFQTAYFALEAFFHSTKNNQMDSLFGLSTGNDRVQQILARARDAHGELVDLVVPVFEEQIRQQDIIQRRSTITSDEHRFFLALLLNVPDREKILELVQQRFPETDPVEKILDWVEELSQTRVLGSKEGNALGLEGFGDDHIFVLEYLLRGKSLGEIRQLIQSDEFQRFAALGDQLETIAGALQNSPLFKTMLCWA